MNLQKTFEELVELKYKEPNNPQIDSLVQTLSKLEYDCEYLQFVLKLMNLQEYKNMFIFLQKQHKRLQKDQKISQIDWSLDKTEILNIYDLEKLRNIFLQDCEAIIAQKDEMLTDFLYCGLVKFFDFFTIIRSKYKQKYCDRKKI